MTITTLWIVNIFSIYKDLHESILISPKLWLILSLIPVFPLTRYLVLTQISSNNP